MKKSDGRAVQHARFIETARAIGCDEDKEKFEDTLRKVAAHKPSKNEAKKRPLKGRSVR